MLNDMRHFIESLLSAEKGSLSSKRLCGIIGWICCSVTLILCTVWDRQAPDMVSTVIYASGALLGLDSVTGIWKDRSSTTEEEIKK